MPVELIKDPTVTVPAGARRWVSVHNPIEYQFRRKDYNLVDIQIDGAPSSFLIVTADANINEVEVGERVYLGDSGDFTGEFIINTKAYSGDPKKLRLVGFKDYNNSNTGTPGFMNVERVGYRLQMRFTNRDISGFPEFAVGDFYPRPDGLHIL